jgi:glutamyl-tRNA(Gln) amidotransferase subunit D
MAGAHIMLRNGGEVLSRLPENTGKSMPKPVIRGEIDPNVPMMWLSPATKETELTDMFETNKASVIVGTGLGHVRSDLVPTVKKYVERGRMIVLTSSCIFGRVDMEVYSTGRDLVDSGIIDSGPMTPETAHVKLMWSMGTSVKTGDDPIKLFKNNISGEWDPIFPRISSDPAINQGGGGPY